MCKVSFVLVVRVIAHIFVQVGLISDAVHSLLHIEQGKEYSIIALLSNTVDP